MPKPTEEQQAVIRHLDGNLVVKAGAGSGKTFVLARRFAQALVEGPGWQAADMDEVVAITFTRKAATELVERVRRVLLSDPGTIALSRRVDEAWATTIDSFCAQLLRRHAVEAGIDPLFAVASVVEAGVLFGEAFERVIDGFRRSGGPEAEMLAAYGTEEVYGSVSAALRRLRSCGASLDEVSIAPARTAQEAMKRFEQAATVYEAAVAKIGGPSTQTLQRNLQVIGDVRECAGLLLHDHSPAGRIAGRLLFEGSFSRAGTKAAEALPDVISALDAVKGAMAAHLTARHAEAFLGVARKVVAAYERAKCERGLLDFQDLVTKAAELMRDHPEIAQLYRGKFRIVMVDEFQDTNQIQVDLIRSLSADNLCAVGDVRQSIYSFRDADVSVFERLIETVDRARTLTANYRSHPAVLSVLNEIFSRDQFFGADFQQLVAATEAHDPPTWPLGAPRVELHVVDASALGPCRSRQTQAEVFGNRVAALLSSGVPAADIVLLLRNMTGAATYASALRDRGIPVVLASGEAFVDQAEVGDVAAALKAIVAPDDDEALIRVLAGRMVALSPDALHALRAEAGRGSLWSAVEKVAGGQMVTGIPHSDAVLLCTVAAAVRELRNTHGAGTLVETTHAVVDAFDYDLTLLASGPDGSRAWANVLKLIDIAAEFESVTYGDAGAFLEYLEDFRRHNAREAAASATSHDAAVRIASIHSAKGLEFPVVFLADLDAALTHGDSTYFQVAPTPEGLALGRKMPPDGLPFEKTPDATYKHIAEREKDLQIAEEKRVFYVGCTRAREALMLIGTGRPDKPNDRHLCGIVVQALGLPLEDSDYELAPGSRIRYRVHRPEEWEERQPSDATSSAAQGPTDGGDYPELETPPVTALGVDPPPPALVPSLVSYSALAAYARCPRRYRAEHHLGIGGGSQESPALRLGSAVHSVMQRTVDGVFSQEVVDAAARAHVLDEEHRTRLEVAVRAGVASPLVRRTATAERAERELPFGIMVGASRLAGTIDVIAWEGDSALIVDYKTGSADAAHDAENGSSGRTRSGVRSLADPDDLYALQAACYALAAITAGSRAVDVSFVFVEEGGDQLTYWFDADDANAIRAHIERRIEDLASPHFGPRSMYDPRACAGCPVRAPRCPR